MEKLRGYSWPGNIRELQSMLKQSLLRSTGPVLIPAFLPMPLGASRASPAATISADESAPLESFIRQRLQAGSEDLYQEAIRRLEQFLLPLVLQSTGGNKVHAARILGITRLTLRMKLRELGLSDTKSVDADEDEPV